MTRMTRNLSAEDARAARCWYVADADGKVLGRLASRIASELRGKPNPASARHIDAGSFVVVLNGAKVRLTGRKLATKEYLRHTEYPGGIRCAAGIPSWPACALSDGPSPR